MENAALNLKSLGDALVSLRTQRGMSRRDLAESSGLSYPYVAELEKGRKNPSSRALGALSAALDVEPLALQSISEGRTSIDEVVWPGGHQPPTVGFMQPVAQAQPPTPPAEPMSAPRSREEAAERELVDRITAAVVRELGPMVRDTVARAVREAGIG